ncbi:MAG: type IV conjugative transfer system protein TraL [Alphaproteobacteria bacterium]|nr:type IV conjugative transfer system protein TraL [Alphaproteobacteria bacterium]
MSLQQHVILNHVDTPVRFLFWTKEEALLILAPFMLGSTLDFILLGFITSLSNFYLIHLYKRYFGKGQLQAVRYWFFPVNPNRLSSFPPSYIREFIGEGVIER